MISNLTKKTLKSDDRKNCQKQQTISCIAAITNDTRCMGILSLYGDRQRDNR